MASLDRIDVHAHAFPEAYLRTIGKRYPQKLKLQEPCNGKPLIGYWSRSPLPSWDLDARIAEMDRDRVRTEVLSAPTIYSHLDDQSAEDCRLLNDFQADLVGKAPGRFLSLLHLPVNDVEASLRELSRWKDRSEATGVVFGSNMGGVYPGDPRLLPIWEAIDKLGMPTLIHPVPPPAVYGPVIPTILLFPLDSTTAAASIIYSGLFERFPGLKIIIPHLGGALPFLRERLDMAIDIAGFPTGQGQDLPKRPSRYVDRFYFDLAQGYHGPAFDCTCAVAGIDHLLYGTDHFFLDSAWRPRLNAFIDGLPLSVRDRAAILRGNAERILR
ncbi:MAG: amidohydrolase family protein [Myxococcales bacterium]|nr:amidohydrolase family protein [Myxococcales bacterium]